ncbi:ribbon-helix-helix protein, CopG family [Streptomyces tirandamycinicus]|uniref:ribbon-helix-helix protein, CopG family n=1 Tax=Streptomyces tirandamycinicus TaxID=2174846 RepID=UPI003CC5545D
MRQVTVRLDDDQAARLESLMASGESANAILRAALTHYYGACNQARSLRDAGHPGGMIQTQVEIGPEGITLVPLPPLIGVRA